MAKIEYKIVAAELWGNAKDGFETNDWCVIERITRYKEFTQRKLTEIARNAFEGRSFAWSENVSRPMRRKAITVDWLSENSYQVEYHGYYVGEIQVIEVLPDGIAQHRSYLEQMN